MAYARPTQQLNMYQSVENIQTLPLKSEE